MKFEQTFEGRIFNRLAIGPTLSARADCSHIAAEADAEIERLRALADSEGTRAVDYLRRARKAEAEIESLKMAEEGAKTAFAHVVEQKNEIEAECKKLRSLLDGAYADIRRKVLKA